LRCENGGGYTSPFAGKVILKLDHPIKFGPITVNDQAGAGAGAIGTPSQLHPEPTAMQHSEIFGYERPLMHSGSVCLGSFEAFSSLTPTRHHQAIYLPHAKIHRTLNDRFALETVIDCASKKVGSYRPEVLREHDDFKQFYPDPPTRMRHRPAEVKNRRL
jgi:hypothetical protein